MATLSLVVLGLGVPEILSLRTRPDAAAVEAALGRYGPHLRLAGLSPAALGRLAHVRDAATRLQQMDAVLGQLRQLRLPVTLVVPALEQAGLGPSAQLACLSDARALCEHHFPPANVAHLLTARGPLVLREMAIHLPPLCRLRLGPRNLRRLAQAEAPAEAMEAVARTYITLRRQGWPTTEIVEVASAPGGPVWLLEQAAALLERAAGIEPAN